MPLFVGQLYRLIPIIVAVVAILIIVYAVVWNTRGGRQAKEALLKVIMGIGGVGGLIFLLFTGYAAAEGNSMLTMFFGSCLALFACLLLVGYICHRILEKHNRENLFRVIKKPEQDDSEDRD